MESDGLKIIVSRLLPHGNVTIRYSCPFCGPFDARFPDGVDWFAHECSVDHEEFSLRRKESRGDDSWFPVLHEECHDRVYAQAELEANVAADEAAFADSIASMLEFGWRPAPRVKGEWPLVWRHDDGTWGISVAGVKPDPGRWVLWWEAKRIRTLSQMLGWLYHLSGETWFTAKHARQMTGLYYELHPNSRRPI